MANVNFAERLFRDIHELAPAFAARDIVKQDVAAALASVSSSAEKFSK